MDSLKKLIENNPGLFRIVAFVLGPLIGFLFYYFFIAG